MNQVDKSPANSIQIYTHQFKLKAGKSFGIGVRFKNGQVYVSSIKENSILKDVLQIGDAIKAINGTPVDSKQACRRLIIANKNNLQISYQRRIFIDNKTEPGSNKGSRENESQKETGGLAKIAVAEENRTVTLKTAESFSEEISERWSGLPRDVCDILKSQFTLIKKSGLRKGSDLDNVVQPGEVKIFISENVDRHDIGSDVPRGKNLRRPPH